MATTPGAAATTVASKATSCHAKPVAAATAASVAAVTAITPFTFTAASQSRRIV